MRSKDPPNLARLATVVSTVGFVGLIYLGAFRLTEAEWWEWAGGVLLWLAPIAVLIRQAQDPE